MSGEGSISGAVERAELHAAVEQSADAVVITNAAGDIHYVNAAFTAMTGYSREEVLGKNPRVLKSERQSRLFYKDLWETITAGRVWHGELINQRKDGTPYAEEMRITPVRGSGGEIVSYIAIKHDVTERLEAEEAKGLLAAIVESSGDAIAAYSPEGVICTWNKGAEGTFGYSAEEAIGTPLARYVAPERLLNLPNFTEQILAGDSISQYESICVRKGGGTFPVSVTGSPIKNRAGTPVAVAAVVRDISEQRKTEQARGLLASIVESSDDAIIGGDLDGTIISWNRGAEALFGYSRQEIVGRHAEILAPSSRLGELTGVLHAIRNGHAVNSFETIRCRKDGSAIDVSIRVSPILNSDGEPVGNAAIMRDIGERLRVEREFRESEARFREVFEHAPFGIGVNGEDGRIWQANAALCRMLGYSEEELSAKTWMELTHPDDRDAALQRRQQLWSGNSGFIEGDKRYLHRSGQVVWARIRASLVRDGNGSAMFSVLHVEDISERKRSEAALQESEERFRIMADTCPTMMWVTDADGMNEFVNRTYRGFFGITWEESNGGKWRALVHPDDAAHYSEAFERAVRERASFRAEARVRRADGEWRWLGSHAEPRLASNGDYLGHVGLSSDITERRQAEQTIRDSEEFAQSTINALSSHVCVLNETGTILAVNQAWRDFAEANEKPYPKGTSGEPQEIIWFGAGVNYLDVCDRAAGSDSEDAAEIAAGIREVLDGRRKQYSQEYPCHSPVEKR